MAKSEKSAASAVAAQPVELSHTTFVDYCVAHWIDCQKKGTRPKTIFVQGQPGIGKSSAAKDIAAKMTNYVRANPGVIFGVKTLKEAVVLLEEERQADLLYRTREKVIEQNLQRATPLDAAGLEKLIETTVEIRSSYLEPITEKDILAVCEILDFSSKLPEDLGGLPFRNGEFTDYCPQRWVAKLCGKYSFGVFVQDDLPASPQAMQVAGRQSALENRIHDHEFSNGILVMVTGNRREDKAAAGTLPSHFRNSVTILSIKITVAEWRKWYSKQPGAHPVVSAFLALKTDLLCETPGSSKDKLGAFATPRQWFSLGVQFEAAEQSGETVLLAVASGLVGKANASTFIAFNELRKSLVDPEKLLDNPKGEMPDPRASLNLPDKRCAVALALGEHAANRWTTLTGPARDEVPEKLLHALSWVSQAGNEYSALGFQSFLDSGGDIIAMARMARAGATDPVVGRLMDHVKNAVLPGLRP